MLFLQTSKQNIKACHFLRTKLVQFFCITRQGAKMFEIRPRKTVTSRQLPLPLIEIVAYHEQLPPLEKNWATRWCTMSIHMEHIYERLLNFEVRNDDVFLLGFMKSGNTWMNEVLWQLMNGLDLNYKSLKENESCRHFFELNGFFPGLADRIASYEKLCGPRLLQSHLPANLLPKQYWQKKPKTVYVARNVKDVITSYYHFINGLGWSIGTMDEYVQDFINDDALNSPYWAHVVDFWKLRHEPFILFITYEEMKRDLAGVIKKLCTFLEKPGLTECELKALLDHLSFEHLTVNKKFNPTERLKELLPQIVQPNLQFMRRGIVGSYKDELSVENQNLLNEWTRRCLAKHDLTEEDIFGRI